MSRSERLLDLLQLLRRHRRPVAGAVMAEELGVSLRTLYRDIATLQAQGAAIEGEPGVGYVLKPGFVLPPLMFSVEEIEALVLGSRWVAAAADGDLKTAARDVLAKIAAVLPPDLREEMEGSTLLVPKDMASIASGTIDVSVLRRAIRSERKLVVIYRDVEGVVTERVIWPFLLGFLDHARIVGAWCELRQGFRHFRADRIESLSDAGMRYPRRRQALLQEWREATGYTDKN
ncbi:MAG TPA: YafY family protein [Stellaceae bacterium]|nr:YafY family protein [Stellaceae bacterium]